MYDITIVVPTYNRLKLLTAAVESLRRQTYASDCYEILIISDGATDGTDEAFAQPLEAPRTRLLRQEVEGFGLSAARNYGIREGEGRLVMFFDDDMVAHEQMVEMHIVAHSQVGDEVAVRGRVFPSPELPETPFCQIVLGDICRLYEENPDQGRFIDFHNAVSWQTSYHRETIAGVGGYDETFRVYGWEDIEFSYRWSQAGLRFYYDPRPISYHNDQRQTLAAHAKRMRTSSKMAPILFQRHPELIQELPMYFDKAPIVWGQDSPGLIAKKMVRQAFASRLSMSAMERLTPMVEQVVPSPKLLRRWYYGFLGGHVLQGYREGLLKNNGHA
jgi:glycosyltransferase involved in cell wall biosynthesis